MDRAEPFRVLAINPGSTSTKIAVFDENVSVLSETIRHTATDMAPFRCLPILEQATWRATLVREAIARHHVAIGSLHAVVGRGGLLPPVASGTYRVTDAMIEELRAARRGEHASNLGAVIARTLARHARVDAFVVDPVSIDEWTPVARLSGSALFERDCLWHALNSKAVAKRFARERATDYASLRLIVVHLGSGISVSAHRDGQAVDSTNAREEGAFSAERAGSVPSMKLARWCISTGATIDDAERHLFREGGLFSYLGTKDLAEVERRIDAGDSVAALIVEAMAYQIAKEIGAMSTVLHGEVDAVLITGGMAHSARLVESVRSSVEWIAPVVTFPGEDEMLALAEGALRVLRGTEVAMTLPEASPLE